jgi:hypothetical protein
VRIGGKRIAPSMGGWTSAGPLVGDWLPAGMRFQSVIAVSSKIDYNSVTY